MSDLQMPGSLPPGESPSSGRSVPRQGEGLREVRTSARSDVASRRPVPPNTSSRGAPSSSRGAPVSGAASRSAGRSRIGTALVGIPLVALVVWQGGAWLVGVAAVLAFIAMRELIVAGRRHRTPLVIELAYPLLFVIFFALLRAGAAWSQLVEMLGFYEMSPPATTERPPIEAGAVAEPVLALAAPAVAFLAVPLLLLIFAVWRYPARKNVSLPSVALTTLAIGYVALFAFLPLLREMPRGLLLIWILLLGVWTGDTLAFYAGRAWGRAKLTPLSPGKTRAGVVAGFVATVAACTGSAALTSLEWQHGVALGALIGLAAPLGDLAESFWKRELEVKDMSNLLPGHGGVLDRCDSLLFAAPVVYLYALWQLR